MTKYVIYNHPAFPPLGIKVGITYDLNELLKMFTLDEIKCFFQPDNFTWEQLDIAEKIVINKK
jgi:hypothetical protein